MPLCPALILALNVATQVRKPDVRSISLKCVLESAPQQLIKSVLYADGCLFMRQKKMAMAVLIRFFHCD